MKREHKKKKDFDAILKKSFLREIIRLTELLEFNRKGVQAENSTEPLFFIFSRFFFLFFLLATPRFSFPT